MLKDISQHCVNQSGYIMTASLDGKDHLFTDYLKVGSHDPIFSSNYSSVLQVSDIFYALDESRTCSIFIQLDQKSPQFFIFPRSILRNIFTKWPPLMALSALKRA